MRRKNLSKRRWRARMMMGLWIPGMVIDAYGFTVPDGYMPMPHPELDFWRIVKCGMIRA